ncbi:prophage MuSo2, virion morphogenesis protein [gamma proteobacterium IMCC1989]|nr:prophage MuSo2, virion morphogenesis protein [gamma proteobacterium IMCC1989]
MSGVGASLELQGLDRLNNVLSRLRGVDTQQLVSVLGGVVEDQTKKRIIDERESPDGDAWAEWSPWYADTRHGNQELLQSGGGLVDSIQSLIGFGAAEIGTNLDYAATHNYGDVSRGIPQREFIGVSTDNLDDLQSTLDGWANDLIQGAL